MNIVSKALIGLLIFMILGGLGFYLFVQSLSLPTTKEAGLSYRTAQSLTIPEEIGWRRIEFAKELINQQEKTVVVDGGDNPVPHGEWADFTAESPWVRNLNRNLLFEQTHFLRSPNAPESCRGDECLIIREYKGHSWVELAQQISVDFIPDKTNLLKPEPGHLAVKVIKKCQIMDFGTDIHRMTDNHGNDYVMHATETGTPSLDVILPDGWNIERMTLDQPLIIAPFGSSGECYFNVVGDHLGQGYHQYRYAGDVYPQPE